MFKALLRKIAGVIAGEIEMSFPRTLAIDRGVGFSSFKSCRHCRLMSLIFSEGKSMRSFLVSRMNPMCLIEWDGLRWLFSQLMVIPADVRHSIVNVVSFRHCSSEWLAMSRSSM